MVCQVCWSEVYNCVVINSGVGRFLYSIKFPISALKLYLSLYCGFLAGDAISLDVTPAPVLRPSSVAAVRIKGPSL